MTIKIPLQVEGIDLSCDTVLANMDPDLDELDWVAQGPITLAVVYSEENSPRAALAEAHDWVLRIHKLQPGASVTRVFDELVGWSEIAARCAVTPEAVRTWAKGLRRGQAHSFPAARQVVPLGAGKRSLYLYGWREVLMWVRDVIQLDPDENMTYLEDSHIAELDASIAYERGTTPPSEYTPLPGQISLSSKFEDMLTSESDARVRLKEASREQPSSDWHHVVRSLHVQVDLHGGTDPDGSDIWAFDVGRRSMSLRASLA